MLVCKHSVFDFVEKTELGLNDEIWLTDSVELIRKSKNRIFGFPFTGTRFDIGTFESLKEADIKEQMN